MIVKIELSGEKEEVDKFKEVIYALSDTEAFECVMVDCVGYMED